MVDKKVVLIGVLILSLLVTGVVYIQLNDRAKIRVDNDKTTFYVKEGSYWRVSGREYNKLLDANSLLYRDVSEIRVSTTYNQKSVKIERYTPFKRGPVIKDTYFFLGNTSSVELFPISHTVEVYNATGYYYKYEVRDLVYDGDTYRLDGEQTSAEFGRNMKVSWWDGYRLGWVYKSGSMYVKSEKIEEDYARFDVRLYDPVSSTNSLVIYQDDKNDNRKYELQSTSTINIVGINETTVYEDANTTNITAGYLYTNYTKPPNAKRTLSLWQVKHGDDSPNNYNITIPDDCWFANPTTLMLRIESNYTYPSRYYSVPMCSNGTEWVHIGTGCYGSGSPSTQGYYPNETLTYDGDWSTWACYDHTNSRWIDKCSGYGGSARIYEERMIWGTEIKTNYTICVDIDSPYFGDNFSCANNTNLTLNYSEHNVSFDLFVGDVSYDNYTYNNTYGYFSNWMVQVPFHRLINVTEFIFRLYGIEEEPTQKYLPGNITKVLNEGGNWTNTANSGDGDWSTYANSGGVPSNRLYFNETFVGYDGNFSWTFKYMTNIGGGQNLVFQCYNYSSSSYVSVYSEACGASTDNQTKEKDIHSDCYNDSHILLMVTACETDSRFFEGNISFMERYNIPNYPGNLSIDVFNDSTYDIIFPGYLNGSRTYINRFSNQEKSENLTFGGAGTITRYFNYSTHEVGTTTVYDVTIKLGGYTIDTETLDFEERFWNTSYILSSTGELPNYPYDDFTGGEVSGRWTGSYSLSGNDYVKCESSASGGGSCPYYGGTWSTTNDADTFYMQDTDLQDHKEVIVRYYLSSSARCNNPSCPDSTGATGSSAYGIRDSLGNTYIISSVSSACQATFSSDSDNDAAGPANDKIQFRDDGYIYVDEVKKWAYYTNRDYYLYGQSNGQGKGTGTTGSGETRFYDINMSGFTSPYGKNMTFDNNTEAVFISTNHSFDSNISRAILTTYKSNTGGGTEHLWLSIDNGTTWESTTSGAIHSFTQNNYRLRTKINLTVTDNSSPLIIDYYTLEVIPGTIENLSIDVGNDGVLEYNSTGTINESNSPQNITLNASEFRKYLVNGSCTGTTCLIPVLFKTQKAGMLEVKDMEGGQNTTIVNLNTSHLQEYLENNCTGKCNMTFGFSSTNNGVLQTDNLRHSYLGDGRVHLTAHLYNYSYHEHNQTSAYIDWRHSPFALSLPQNIVNYDLFPKSHNDKEVEPYGQKNNSPIFNFSSYAKTDPIDIRVCINESVDDCLNITWSSDYDKVNAQELLSTENCTSTINVTTNLKNDTWTGIYNWWNLTSCGTSAFQFLQYNLVFDSFCSECVKVN